MSYTQIEIDAQFDGKLQLIYLNQPDSFNSLTKVMLGELRDAVHKFSEDENVRCVAIAGKGKAFCAGQNLKEALTFGEEDDDRAIQRFVIEYYNPLVLRNPAAFYFLLMLSDVQMLNNLFLLNHLTFVVNLFYYKMS